MPKRCIGRDEILEEVRRALDDSEWVTVAGPPGSGKTLVVDEALRSRDGVVWVRPRRGDVAIEIVRAACAALGVTESPDADPAGSLLQALGGSGATLVIDGVPTAADGLSTVLAQVAASLGNSRIVCTSRSVGGLPEEHVIRVGGLPLPLPEEELAGPGVEVFRIALDRAGRRDAALSDEPRLRTLLESTAGLPLLLEQLAVQVAHVGLAGAQPVHAIDEALDQTYALLGAESQCLYRRLAGLPGPIGLVVAGRVCGAAGPDGAARATADLARLNLVEVDTDGRLALLAPIRKHGLQLQTDADRSAIQDRLVEWADEVLPADFNSGAADAPWLPDVPTLAAAVSLAAGSEETRPAAYDLANRAFSSLYSAMQTRAAVDLLESALLAGDGPPALGAQVARRAGIAASEVDGSYAGLSLLDRADTHAATSADPDRERARTASIRAEMHLDAGDLHAARKEASRVLQLRSGDRIAEHQALRTLTEIHVAMGDFVAATQHAEQVISRVERVDDEWLGLSARLLLGHIALEQGRVLEARAVARDVADRSADLGEDRIQLIAALLLHATGDTAAVEVAVEVADVATLPWSLRVPVLLTRSRQALVAEDVQGAISLAADTLAMTMRARLGRDQILARLLLANGLVVAGDLDQAAAVLVPALGEAQLAPMPLRAADVLDSLGAIAQAIDNPIATHAQGAAAELRALRGAHPWPMAPTAEGRRGARPRAGWVVDGLPTKRLVADITAALAHEPAAGNSRLALLTRSERVVATKVAEGLTSRQIAAALHLSPRTVEAHLAHIYRKLDIPSRARLAAIMGEVG